MQRPASAFGRLQAYISLLLILLPAAAFYFILAKTATRLPILDEWDLYLGSMNQMVHMHGRWPKLIFVIHHQHNGYKSMLNNLAVVLEYSLFGQLRVLPLVAIGNTFALVIFGAVAWMSRSIDAIRSKQYLLLVPVAFLIFQLQYASAVNFASSSLQHLAVVALSLCAIAALSRESARAFSLACFLTLLAIATSPNGFFLVPIGLILQIHTRRWWRMLPLALVTAVMLAVYLYGYAGVPAATTQAGVASSPLHHVNLIYSLSFLGSSAARYSSVAPSVVLGGMLCVVILIALQQRYYAKNPAVFYSMLFVLINAIAVSGLRSDSGVAQSLASRYRIYSNLMLAFTYLFFVENYLNRLENRRLRRGLVAMAFIASGMFCLLSDIAGARFLRGKQLAIQQAYSEQWLHRSDSSIQPAQTNPALQRQIDAGVYNIDVSILRESVRLGVYQPPALP